MATGGSLKTGRGRGVYGTWGRRDRNLNLKHGLVILEDLAVYEGFRTDGVVGSGLVRGGLVRGRVGERE